jgi:YidC/Oxa1 family membrane protein insertase
MSTTSDTTTVPDPSIASDSEVVSQSMTTVTDILQQAHGPIQFGDFAALGLTSWTPAGLIRWSFEIINVVTSMPWFWTIVVGSAFWRFLCVPLTLKAARTAAIMQPHQKELAALQQKVKEVAASRNPLALAKAQREMKALYDRLGISPLGGLVGFLQIPITLGLFFAVKKMCDLPVEQLKDSGLAMFPDLTAVDPTMILPIAMTVAVNVQLLVS